MNATKDAWQAVASQGTPLHQALHDYEIEMLRAGFGVVPTYPPGMQRRGLGIPFTPGQEAQ